MQRVELDLRLIAQLQLALWHRQPQVAIAAFLGGVFVSRIVGRDGQALADDTLASAAHCLDIEDQGRLIRDFVADLAPYGKSHLLPLAPSVP